MAFNHYRYIVFFLGAFLIFVDAYARYIAPLAMIGGMVKKNCSDPLDKGELCWSEQLQANFVGAFYYGYVLQMISTYIATKIGFNLSTKIATAVMAIIQLTVPVTVTFSGTLASALQGLKGFVGGIIMSASYENARKWGFGDEGRMVVSLTGLMIYLGLGTGPFLVGILTERFGWRVSFYISGGAILLLFVLQCLLLPDNPLETKLMSGKEKARFEDKQKNEKSAKDGDQGTKYKVSLLCLLKRPYLYVFCVYHFAQLTVYYPEFTTVPFYFNKFWDVESEKLSYLTLGLSIVAMISVILWKSLLPFMDSKFSWLTIRVTFMLIPVTIRSVIVALIPLSGSLGASIPLLVVNNFLMGTLFAGGLVTLNYDLDPFNGPLVWGVVNGAGQIAGFLIPIVREAMTRVDEKRGDYEEVYRMRWVWFFVLCGGVGLTGVFSAVVGFLGFRSLWKKHPTLAAVDDKDVVVENKAAA
ncbi:hypothetical protein ACHWQZ_G001224 [Mnemiopsis leidyi]